MKRILVGIDMSPEARSAAIFASKLAAAMGSSLILASVVTGADPVGSADLRSRYRAFEDEERGQLTKLLQGLAIELRRPELTVETLVEVGNPAATLAEMASRLDVDLVVVGNRGRGAVKRLLLGSVADRLVHICTKPVTVVH